MGGSLLQGRRVSTAELSELTAELRPVIASILGVRVDPIRSFRAKADHGDLDLVVDAREIDPAPLLAHFRPEAHFVPPKRKLFHFLHRGVQVDLMATEAGCFESTRDYYCFNDMHNLIGKLARHYGLKVGHRGLSYKVYAPGNDANLLAEVVLTHDIQRALTFLGYAPWPEQGFEDLPEIFRYVMSSPLFTVQAFAPETTRNRDRMRDTKRSTYVAFMEQLPESDKEGAGPFPCEKLMLGRALAEFPEFALERAVLFAEHEASKKVSALISGSFISKITGLEGPELGALKTALFARRKDQIRAAVLNDQIEMVAGWVREEAGL